MKCLLREIKSNSGQAIVEYILVLVVAIALMGMVLQFSKAFQTFANNYFGSYLSCLLEMGELPFLGVDGDSSGICNAEFQPFSLTEGRPLNPDANKKKAVPKTGSSQSNGEGGTGGSSARFQIKSPSASRSSSSSSSSSFSSSLGSGQGSHGSGSQHLPIGRKKSKVDHSGSPLQVGKINSSSPPKSNLSGDNTAGATRFRLRSGKAYKDDEEGEPISAKASAKNSDDRQTRKYIPINRAPLQKEVSIELGTFDWTAYLRFIIIAGIIIAILLLLAGQIMQINKSMD